MNVVVKYNLYEEKCFYNSLYQQMLAALSQQLGYAIRDPNVNTVKARSWSYRFLLQNLEDILYRIEIVDFRLLSRKTLKILVIYHFNKMMNYGLIKRYGENTYIFRGHKKRYT